MKTLILVPTEVECRGVFGKSPDGRDVLDLDDLAPGLAVGLTGFGLAGSGALTAAHIERFRPERLILCGLAGVYAPHAIGLGEAVAGTSVTSDGVGRGYGSEHVTAHAMGFHEMPGRSDDRIALAPLAHGPEKRAAIVSVAAISPDVSGAAAVSRRHPEAAIEDMETWSVALAALLFGVPLSVVRAISNVCGDRDKASWRIPQAFATLRTAIERALRVE